MLYLSKCYAYRWSLVFCVYGISSMLMYAIELKPAWNAWQQYDVEIKQSNHALEVEKQRVAMRSTRYSPQVVIKMSQRLAIGQLVRLAGYFSLTVQVAKSWGVTNTRFGEAEKIELESSGAMLDVLRFLIALEKRLPTALIQEFEMREKTNDIGVRLQLYVFNQSLESEFNIKKYEARLFMPFCQSGAALFSMTNQLKNIVVDKKVVGYLRDGGVFRYLVEGMDGHIEEVL